MASDSGYTSDELARKVIRIFNAAVSDYENAIRTALNIPVSFPRAEYEQDGMVADDESEDGGMFL